MNIIEIKNNNFDVVLSDENTLYKLDNLRTFKIIKVKQDKNGNPRYKLQIFAAGLNITNECADVARPNGGRYYIKGNYIIFQSYNISNTLHNYFSNFYKK